MAAAPFSRLDPFDCKSGDFEYYLEQFDQFLAINSVADDEAKKVPLFIASIGQDAYKILKESCGEGVDPKGKSFEELRDLLLQYFARRQFYGRNQRQGEYTGAFINEVKRLSLKCNFGPFQKEALRDRIACGRLPEDNDDKKVATPPQAKSQPKQQQQQQQPQQNQSKKPKNPQLVAELQAVAIPDSAPSKGAKKKQPQQQQNQQQQKKCKICGHLHEDSECPHKDASCFMCRKKGHIASVCRDKIIKGQQQQQRQAPQTPVEVHVHVQQNSAMKNEMAPPPPPAENVTNVVDNMWNMIDTMFKKK